MSADKGQESPVHDAQHYKKLATQLAEMQPTVEDIAKNAQNVETTVGQKMLGISFDQKLREMAAYKEQDNPEDNLTKKERKMYYAIRSILIFLYFLVVPFCQSPGWCLEYYHEKGERHFGFFDCDAVSVLTGYRYSAFPTFSPLLTILIDLACLISFNVMAIYQNSWRNQTPGEKRRTQMLVVASVISLIDLVRCFFAMKYPFFANLMRVFVLLSLGHNLRVSFLNLLRDLRDSFAILLSIFGYILFFVLTVFYFYRPTAEGILNFGSLKDAYRNMTILFTTANYPDIFLMSMNDNYFNCFLFMLFMLLGLYFLTNLLVANVFNKYTARMEAKRNQRRSKRNLYIEIIFKKHDADQSGRLNQMEMKAFLADVFDFDYHHQLHRETAGKIMRIIDVNENELYEEPRIKQFFQLPNFIEIAELENLSSIEAMTRARAARSPSYSRQWPTEPVERYTFFEGWVQVVLICTNLFITVAFVLLDQFKEVKAVKSGFWRMLTIPFTCIYLVEAIIVLFSSDGSTILREKKLYLLEVVCQICSGLGYFYMYTEGTQEQFAEGAAFLSFAFLLRNLRVTILLQEMREFKVIMLMIMRMTEPILIQLACLYIVYYIFAIWGMYGLGGKIRMPNFHSEDGIPNNLYYLVNFNDLGMSVHTLYAFMIINNWPAMTDMMVNTSGEVWPRIYFMIFYILVQWILLNIVIAMMLDIFTSVDDELDIEFKRLENIKKLKALQKQMGEYRFNEYCDQANEVIMMEAIESSELVNRAQAKAHESKKKNHGLIDEEHSSR